MFRGQSNFTDPLLTPIISEEDKAYCLKRGIPIEAAIACGLFTQSKHQVANTLGRSHYPTSALMIPMREIKGEPTQYRIRNHEPIKRADGKDQRWTCSTGVAARPYICPAIEPERWAAMTKVIIVEGAVKAISVMANTEILSIGLGGVETGHDTDALKMGIERLCEEILRLVLDWSKVTVIIAFDSNRRNKVGVLRGEKRIARCFANAGVKDVQIVELPPNVIKEKGKDEREEDWGPDDFIAANGGLAFKELLEQTRSSVDIHQPFKEIGMRLKRSNKTGEPKSTVANVSLVLSMDPRWEGKIGFNEFSERFVIRMPPPWDPETMPAREQKPGTPWSDADDTRLSAWLSTHWGIDMSPEKLSGIVAMHAFQHPFHEVRHYLGELAWDTIQRIDTFMEVYFGAQPTPYNRAVARKWLISMVARVMEPGSGFENLGGPGCKADCVPVFEGVQGARKSTAMRILSKGWFSDRLSSLENKDSMLELQGVWLFELSEFDALLRYDPATLKSFFSRDTERYRSPYGRKVEDHPRQCIFAGTTNHDAYLKDDSGARRFWPIMVGMIDVIALKRDVDQIWAEAVHLYRNNETWWMEGTEEALARKEQDARFQLDAWEMKIEDYVDGKSWVSVGDILERCLEIPVGQWKRTEEMRISSAMRHLGWVRTRQSTGKRAWGYSPKAPVDLPLPPTTPPPPAGNVPPISAIPTPESTVPPVTAPATSAAPAPVTASLFNQPKPNGFTHGDRAGAEAHAHKDASLFSPFVGTAVEFAQEHPTEPLPMDVSDEEAKSVAVATKPQAVLMFTELQQRSMLNRVAGMVAGGDAPQNAWKTAIARERELYADDDSDF